VLLVRRVDASRVLTEAPFTTAILDTPKELTLGHPAAEFQQPQPHRPVRTRQSPDATWCGNAQPT
jgi:hypothetical protein